jgi:hypothetical protein
MMYAVRCLGQTRGFRVNGEFFASQRWTLKESVGPELTGEKMLKVIEVEDEKDPRLAPYPVIDMEGVEKATSVSVFDLQQALEERDRRIVALEAQVAEAQDAFHQQEEKLASHEAQSAALKDELTSLKVQVEEVKTSVETFPEAAPAEPTEPAGVEASANPSSASSLFSSEAGAAAPSQELMNEMTQTVEHNADGSPMTVDRL